MTGAEVASRTWLRYERSDAPVSLVCIPHAGAGAASFTRWLGLFPPAVAAVRVQLPGREDVVAEPPLRRVHDAVDLLLPQITQLPQRTRLPRTRIALYGHSMGALVAFELARALTVAGTPPVHLFVSGRRAPHLPARRAPIHRLPDDAFAAALEEMGGPVGGPAFLRYALPLLRADLALSEEYTYRPEWMLRCPVTAFSGTGDPIVDRDEVEAWEDLTDGAFALHSYAGDHFFHQRHRVSIAAHITDAVA